LAAGRLRPRRNRKINREKIGKEKDKYDRKINKILFYYLFFYLIFLFSPSFFHFYFYANGRWPTQIKIKEERRRAVGLGWAITLVFLITEDRKSEY